MRTGLGSPPWAPTCTAARSACWAWGRSAAESPRWAGPSVWRWWPGARTSRRKRTQEVGTALAASKEELLEAGDFVAVHLALSDRTRGLIGAAELARMRPTAYLVNASRAAIVDQDALLAALHAGTIAGAGLDVFDVEPLPAGHPMRTAPRLLATPHLGYVSRANYATYYGQAVENIRAFLDGEPVRRIG
ncbi:2-hydroxyacid dehydrogenase OS=Streptomyces microflavus OX=1919 GN=Smic_00070 PE=3 SV=1 [Streptomyces microflavus]